MINKKAVTLIELIIVMTIISILGTLGFISLKGWTASARDSVRIDDIANINTAIDLYKVDRSKYPEPTNPVDITHSGAIVWTQGGFGKDTMRQTGRIFGELQDPTYDINYAYSVTNSRQEFQLAYVLEDPIDNLTAAVNVPSLDIIPSTYAAGEFSPDEFNPIIWLDGEDIDGDGDNTDNPSNNSNVTSWVNKSTAGSANNPTLTNGNLKFSTNGFYGSYPGVFIASNRGLRLDNSAITDGDIFYVVQNNDPFNNTDTNGRGLQSTTGDYLIGYWGRNRNAIRINNAPDKVSNSPATSSNRTAPFVYGYHTDNGNFSFRDTGNVLDQGGSNSISGREWGFNRAGNYNERADFVVSEILVFSSPLSASEREKVEGYLAHKWGQDYFLPTSHPYKNTPPEGGTPPPAPDTDPDTFSLNTITDGALSAEFTSNSITVTGINTSTPISITTGGTYSINGGSYISSDSTVNENDIVTVRQTSSSSNSTAVSTTLTIGSISDTFTVTTLDGDTSPDSFSFNPVSDADLSTSYTSNSISISGINTGTSIGISGGDATYSISSGVSGDLASGGTASAGSTYGGNPPSDAFDNDSVTGWGNNDELPVSLQYDLGSGAGEIATKYTLYRNSSQTGGWSNSNYSPSDWLFQGSNNGTSWVTLDTRTGEEIKKNATKKEYTFSNTTTYRYYRIYITKSKHPNWEWVNITEMEIMGSAASYTSSPGTVNDGDIVTVRMTSSNSAGTTETGTLTVGSASEDFTISTLAPDTIPDDFSFTDVEDANLNSQYTSNTITVSGINTGIDVSISSPGTYSINGGSYTSSDGTVNNGDTINVRLSSSASNSITTTTTLDLEGVTAPYNVTTPAPPPDTIPDSFVFVDVTDANLSTQYISNTITVSGINAGADIDISGGEYDINGDRNYISTSGTATINNGDIISVRGTSSSSVGSMVPVTLTIGTISDTFNITTVEPDTTPDSFTFNDVTNATLDTLYYSNPITISGVNTTTDIIVTGGSYSLNGGTYTSANGTVQNGDVVRLSHTSSSSSTTDTDTTISVGNSVKVSDTFTTTTVLADITPDAFTFNDKLDVNLNSVETSQITVSGINTGIDISISSPGSYSINGGPYTSSNNTVYNGDTITARLTSSAVRSDSVNSTITIGGIPDIFTVTTIAAEPELSTIVTREPSSIYVEGNFNGLFSHGVSSTNGNHYVFITPSIITTDTTNLNFLDIINDKKFVYTGYDNYPATYVNADPSLTSRGGFDQYRISGPIIFEGTKKDLASYSGIKQVDNGVRSTYRTTELYRQSARYLDNYGTAYVEDILGNIIGINPIKPYFCSDILDKEFTENIANEAFITATSSNTYGTSGTGAIANGIKSTEGKMDYEYHSDTGNAFIDFEWEEDKPVGFIRIYNRTGCCSSRLSGATVSLYDSTNVLLYTHTLWDTTNDFVVDLDLEGIGKLYNNVRKLTIRSQGGNVINIREVEVYVGGTIQDGFYFVDSDGIGGKKPYEVYCDMTTDGGGWTKIGDNYVLNGNFSDGNHALDYPSSTGNWNRENNVGPYPNPSDSPNAMKQGRALNGDHANVDYDIVFSDVLAFQVDSEIRLSAWVADAWDEGDSEIGGKGYIFHNRLTYTDGSFSEDGERVTLDTQVVDGKTWKHQMVRIPITKEVAGFIWEVGNGAETTGSRDFYFADLKAEIYYK